MMSFYGLQVGVVGMLTALVMVPCEAALTYSLDIEVADTVLPPSETVAASLVLREISDGVDDPSISLRAGSGVAGFSARVFRSSGDAVMSNFRVVEGFNFFGPNPSPNPNLSPSDVQMTLSSANFFSGVGSGTDRTEMVLANFDITAGNAMESVFQVGNLEQSLPNPLGIGAAFGAFREVNASSINFGGVTVTAVPEPGSVLALSVFAVGGLVYRRRRMARVAN